MSNVITEQQNPGCLIQILWFAFVGWWLGQAWIVVAWLLMVTVIGLPFGVWMLDRLPKVIALRSEPVQRVVTRRADGSLTTEVLNRSQVNILLRALYFILIGWWLSAIWMELAYAVSLTIIGLPLGFWMFDCVPAIVSLKK